MGSAAAAEVREGRRPRDAEEVGGARERRGGGGGEELHRCSRRGVAAAWPVVAVAVVTGDQLWEERDGSAWTFAAGVWTVEAGDDASQPGGCITLS